MSTLAHLRIGLLGQSPQRLPAAQATLAWLVEKERPHLVIEERIERLLGDPPEVPR